jgi:hypothetical protein
MIALGVYILRKQGATDGGGSPISICLLSLGGGDAADDLDIGNTFGDSLLNIFWTAARV